ncbi:uncharacterized protein K444DRAFT_519378, partial [Hyaloscypha bicolor E]
SRLLDLVEIFREYTEFGCICYTSTLLASQVANLENTTKRIEIYILTSSSSARNTNKSLSARNTSSSSTCNTSSKSMALSRKSTFLLAYIEQASLFSAISIRNSLNTTFCSKGIKGLVISIVSLFSKGNIIVNTTPEFNSDFLVQNQAIIKGVLSLYKVIIYGLPIHEFNIPEGIDLVLEEIKTFNKGLEPISQPY